MHAAVQPLQTKDWPSSNAIKGLQTEAACRWAPAWAAVETSNSSLGLGLVSTQTLDNVHVWALHL